jgi:hypothetical protein
LPTVPGHNLLVRVAFAAIALALALAAPTLAATRSRHFLLHVGHARIFALARGGDHIVCIGRGDSIRLTVPRWSRGTNAYRTAFDKKLSLTVGPRDPRRPRHPPGVVARCAARR